MKKFFSGLDRMIQLHYIDKKECFHSKKGDVEIDSQQGFYH